MLFPWGLAGEPRSTKGSWPAAFCRVVDETTRQELARYTLSGGGPYTARIMAELHWHVGGWQLKAIGEPAAGPTFQDLLPAVGPHL